MIVLIFILPEDSLHTRVSLDCQLAPAARLLRWDRPFPLIDLLVLALPAGVLPPAPIHAVLPPDRTVRLLGLAYNKLNCLFSLLGSEPSEELIVIRPFPRHPFLLTVVCNAPALGSWGARCLPLLAEFGEDVFGSWSAGGNIEGRHVRD